MARPRHRKKLKNPNKIITRRLSDRHHKKIPSISDPTIKKVWNNQLSSSQNFRKLGLIADVNKELQISDSVLAGEARIGKIANDEVIIREFLPVPKRPVIENEIIKELENRAQPILREKKGLSENQKRLRDVLIVRHGQDVEKMARDRKLNPYQLTVGQLRRLINQT
jgi:nucleolar protein 16